MLLRLCLATETIRSYRQDSRLYSNRNCSSVNMQPLTGEDSNVDHRQDYTGSCSRPLIPAVLTLVRLSTLCDAATDAAIDDG